MRGPTADATRMVVINSRFLGVVAQESIPRSAPRVSTIATTLTKVTAAKSTRDNRWTRLPPSSRICSPMSRSCTTTTTTTPIKIVTATW